MNIDGIKIDWTVFEKMNWKDLLFDKQNELRILYGVPICDLDLPSDQQQLRSMSWNCIEEVGEAIDVILTSDHATHLGDELADMTAFYIELLIMSGITKEQVDLKSWEATERKPFSEIEKAFTSFSVSLALSINTLKNRYWRKTNLKTDREVYLERLKRTIPLFRLLIMSFGISFKSLMDYYLKKYEVNVFRIRTKY